MTKLTTLETIAHAKATRDRARMSYMGDEPKWWIRSDLYVRAFQDGVRWATTPADEQERQLDAAFKALMMAKPDEED